MNPIKKNHEAMLRTGTMALAAAGASTTAHAATVQITFQNSFVSNTSGLTALDTDFGGDQLPDIVGMAGPSVVMISVGNVILAQAGVGNGVWYASAGSMRSLGNSVGSVAYGLAQVRLTDARIREGVPTDGWLDMTATSRSSDETLRVDVHRFIFDDATGTAPTSVSHANAAFPEYVAVVPEPSGLGLLALGAGGLLARRRRAMAA